MLDYLHYRKSGSQRSVTVFAERLGLFCRTIHMDPDSAVALPRESIEKLLQDYCDKLAARTKLRGASMRTPIGTLDALRAFFRVNGFDYRNSNMLRVEGYYQPPRTRNLPQYIPTLEEVLRMAERARCKRDRALILVAVTTGLRNASLRALRIGDVKEQLERGLEVVRLNIEPDWHEKRLPGSCKNRIPYYVFMATIATKAVKEWLEERTCMFGSYEADEPLFCSLLNRLPREQRRHTMLSGREVQVITHRAAGAASIKQWKHIQPHSLRKTFNSVLRAPLIDNGKMDEADQEFFMGHILGGSRDHYFDSTKVEQMRSTYAKINFDPTSNKGQDASLFLKLAAAFGVDSQKVLEHARGPEGHELTNSEKETALVAAIRGALRESQEKEQKVCPGSELERYMGEGWSFKASLSDGRVVVEK